MPSCLSGSPLSPRKKSSTQGTSWSASCVGSPIRSRKASVGKRMANSATKSHSPSGATSATSRAAISRIAGSLRATAPGENFGFISWRYLMCSGGSIWVGTKRYGGSGSHAVNDSLENRSGFWYSSLTWS